MKRFLYSFLAIVISLIPVKVAAQKATQRTATEVAAQAVTGGGVHGVTPMDSAYHIGHLANGLTYYIRHNEYPKGHADFYIAQKVGSILEEDNQRGLAHFLEHMCFNGTKHFPGQSAINWMQALGVQFGAHVNAYTNYDETVYTLKTVPTERVAVQDSCLLLLRDWSTDLTLDDDAIDSERAVIHEEWRMRNGAELRLYRNLLPKVMPNNKYTERLPIGTMEVVDNFPHQALHDYYKKWYRPDQQAIIVVGDIDVARIEATIKEMFSTVEMPANPAPREYVKVEDLPGTLFAIGRDKEVGIPYFTLNFMHDCFTPEFKQTDRFALWLYIRNAITNMLNSRFYNILHERETAMMTASFDYDQFNSFCTKMAFTLEVNAAGKDIRKTFADAYREVVRLQRYGFTESEYNMAKESILAATERHYANRATISNEYYTGQCVNHFLSGAPLYSAETMLQICKQGIENVPLEVINSMVPQLLTAENRKVLVYLPDRSEYVEPTEQEMQECMAGVEAEEIMPYEDNQKTEPLIPSLLPAGSIVSEAHNDVIDATEWTLSNGVKVIVKPTTLKDNEIIFSAFARGGSNALDDSYTPVIQMNNLVGIKYGFGAYSRADMTNFLQSKNMFFSCNFGDNQRTISGYSSVKNLPTLMELIYASFTEYTINEADYNREISLTSDEMPTFLDTPNNKFADSVKKSLYASERCQLVTSATIDALTREQMLDYAHKMMADASDYTFAFVGNIDMDSIKPLVEQYIANLPTDKSYPIVGKILEGTSVRPGVSKNEFSMAMETPQTHLMFYKYMQKPYNLRNDMITDVVGNILTDRLRNQIRETMGATYSVEADWALHGLSSPNVKLGTIFPMNPEFKDQVLAYIEAEFKNMETSITADELQTAREILRASHKRNLETNLYYIEIIAPQVLTGADFFTNYDDILNSITVDDLQAFIRDLNSANNVHTVILSPEAAAK
jgi:zinc protease